MPDPPPIVVTLLSARDVSRRDAAWSTFLEEYSPALLFVAREMATGQDEAMDHYTFVADQLRADDFRRLRAYASNGTAEFSTWLEVIAKRLCIDNHRRRVGRPQGKSERTSREQAEWEARRNLVNLVALDVHLVGIEDPSTPSPEDSVLAEERREALANAIGDLDASDQLLLTLRFEDEFGLEQIAATLGMATRFHVHRRLKSVLSDLRDSLARQGVYEL